MTVDRRITRNAAAVAASALVHLLVLALFLFQGAAEYQLPQPAEPAMELEITPAPEIIPPERLPPIPEPTKPVPAQTAQAPAPRQTTPRPTPPQPTPLQPAPASPPVAVRPIPTIQAVRPEPLVARQAPRATLAPSAVPTLAPAPAPAAPARPAAVQAPATAPGPTAPRLNIHKSEKEAPAGVPTLPMAPSPAQSSAGGRPATAGGGTPEAGGGGSRLQGLVPYPPGSLPSGGGLRGSLVGCANAQAVGLSSVERAHCDQRFGSAVGNAPHLDDIPPEKRAAFDRAVEKADRDRAYRNQSTGADMTGLGGVAPGSTATTIRLPN